MIYKDGYLLTEAGGIVMPPWEDPIMENAAKTICRKGGKILNIGFGLGLIDTYIQSYNPTEHWIIEPDHTVLKRMKEDGWYDRKNVTIVEGRFADVLPDIKTKFDGIYYDALSNTKTKINFVANLYKNIKKGGVLGIWHPPTESLDMWSNTLRNNGYGVGTEVIDIPGGSIEEHKRVFGKWTDRKFINLYGIFYGRKDKSII